MMIQIKDKEYELKFTVNTLCMMAEDGIDVLNMENVDINISKLRDLFYYGLKHENKKITKNQAGDLMDMYLEDNLIGDLIRFVIESLASSLGKKKEQPEEVAEGEAEEGEGK